MRIFAEENKLGTIELPLSELQIVLAKFAAAFTLLMLMLVGSASAVLVLFAESDFGPIAHDDDGAAAAPLLTVSEAGWSSLELLDANGMQRFERDPAGRWLRHDGLSRDVRTPGDGRAMMIANYQIEGLLGLARPMPASGPASLPATPAR